MPFKFGNKRKLDSFAEKRLINTIVSGLSTRQAAKRFRIDPKTAQATMKRNGYFLRWVKI